MAPNLGKNTPRADHSAFLASVDTNTTGVNLSYLTYTNTGIKSLEEDLSRTAKSPDRLIVLIDFNAMSIANEFGYSKDVDSYLEKFEQSTRECLAKNNLAGKVIRIGGDEYALVLEYDKERTESALKSLQQDLKKLHEETFARDDRYAAAQDYANKRSASRALRSEYLHESGKLFSLQGFKEWLNERLDPQDRRHELALASNTTSGRLQLQVIENEGVRDAPEMMSMSVTSTIHRGPLTRDTFRKGLIQNVRSLHHVKVAGTSATWAAPEELDPSIVIRSDDRAQIAEAERGVKFIIEFEGIADHIAEEHKKSAGLQPSQNGQNGIHPERDEFFLAALREVQLRVASDSSLKDVLRGEFCRDLKVEDLLCVEPGKKIYTLTIDFPGYGIYNNVWDYVRANKLMSNVVQLVGRHFPDNPCTKIRVSGGKLHFLFTEPLEEQQLRKFKSALTQANNKGIRDDEHRERLFAESYEREALRALLKTDRFKQYSVTANRPSSSIALRSKTFPQVAVHYTKEGFAFVRGMTLGDHFAVLP